MTGTFEGSLELRADFNEVYDDDYVWVSSRRTPGLLVDRLQQGEWVRLIDRDGASCLAIVQSVEGPRITCKIDWSTWRAVSADFHASWTAWAPWRDYVPQAS